MTISQHHLESLMVLKHYRKVAILLDEQPSLYQTLKEIAPTRWVQNILQYHKKAKPNPNVVGLYHQLLWGLEIHACKLKQCELRDSHITLYKSHLRGDAPELPYGAIEGGILENSEIDLSQAEGMAIIRGVNLSNVKITNLRPNTVLWLQKCSGAFEFKPMSQNYLAFSECENLQVGLDVGSSYMVCKLRPTFQPTTGVYDGTGACFQRPIHDIFDEDVGSLVNAIINANNQTIDIWSVEL